MKTPSTVIPFPVLYRGFSPVDAKTDGVLPESEQIELIVKHKRVQGCWAVGYYAHTPSDDTHWIISLEDGWKREVMPETIGLLEPTSGHFSGDVCWFHTEIEDIRGIVRFGKHPNPESLNRLDVSFYIDWQGNSFTASILRHDLLHWTEQDDITWAGTMWDPKKKQTEQGRGGLEHAAN